jgi:hypothetical protein
MLRNCMALHSEESHDGSGSWNENDVTKSLFASSELLSLHLTLEAAVKYSSRFTSSLLYFNITIIHTL